MIGAVLRAAPYAAERSLWLDETLLALNVVERDYHGLTRPLDHGQAAPVGFLVLQKLVIETLGDDDHMMRLVPFAAGLGGLILFAVLASRLLPGYGALLAAALFSLNPALIYYGAEAKQYSVDVFVAIGLPLLAHTVGFRALSARSTVALLTAGGLAVWFSHAAVFVCAGVACALLHTAYREERGRDALRLLAIACAWLACIAANYFLFVRNADPTGYLSAFWAHGFMPSPTDVASLAWLPSTLVDAFANPGLLPFAGVGFTLAVAGALSLASGNPGRLLLLAAPAGLTLIAAALGLYPFATSPDADLFPLTGRVILFIVPSMTIVVSEGARVVAGASQPALLGAGWAASLLLLTPLVWRAPHDFLAPLSINEVRPLVEKLSRRTNGGDVVLVNEKGAPILRYYMRMLQRDAPQLALLRVTTIEGKGRTGKIRQLIDAIEPGSRVFLLYAHHPSWRSLPDEAVAVARLRQRGRVVFSRREDGASLHLYLIARENR